MINKERVASFRAELASGRWNKAIGRLHRPTPVGDSFCCQGVGCELALRDLQRGFDLPIELSSIGKLYQYVGGKWPTDVRNYYGFSYEQTVTLVELNDRHPDDNWSHVIAYIDGILSV